jgi:hypothetical protein
MTSLPQVKAENPNWDSPLFAATPRRVLRLREGDTKIGHARCEQHDPQAALDCAFVKTTVLHNDRQAITACAEDRNVFERVAIHNQAGQRLPLPECTPGSPFVPLGQH